MRTSVVLKETRVFFFQGKSLPRPVHKHTLLRWAIRGLRICDSTKRVTLEWAYDGMYRVTSMEALERFHLRRNGELAPARKAKK